VHAEDWTPQTIPTWRHSNWVGVWDPWIVVFKGPKVWYSVVREIVTIERMHRAFARGLMEYGMIRAVKRGGGTQATATAQTSAVAPA
jgi:MPBQ/MSBQ methyltransferase